MPANTHYVFGSYSLDPSTRTLALDGQPLRLMPKDVEVLLSLVEGRGEVVTRERLHAQVWPGVVVEDCNLARHVATLRKALGDTPRTPVFIETLPKVGYRFLVPVAVREGGAPVTRPAPGAEAARMAPDRGPSRRLGPLRRPPRNWLAVGTVAAALSLFGWRSSCERVEAYGPVRSLAVLPVENLTGDPRQDHVAAEIAEMLVNDLGRIRELQVVSRADSRRLGGSTESSRDVGRAIGVAGLLETAIVQADGRLRVTAELVDTRTERLIWAETFEGHPDEVREIQDLIATAAAGALGLGAPPPPHRPHGGGGAP